MVCPVRSLVENIGCFLLKVYDCKIQVTNKVIIVLSDKGNIFQCSMLMFGVQCICALL